MYAHYFGSFSCLQAPSLTWPIVKSDRWAINGWLIELRWALPSFTSETSCHPLTPMGHALNISQTKALIMSAAKGSTFWQPEISAHDQPKVLMSVRTECVKFMLFRFMLIYRSSSHRQASHRFWYYYALVERLNEGKENQGPPRRS